MDRIIGNIYFFFFSWALNSIAKLGKSFNEKFYFLEDFCRIPSINSFNFACIYYKINGVL